MPFYTCDAPTKALTQPETHQTSHANKREGLHLRILINGQYAALKVTAPRPSWALKANASRCIFNLNLALSACSTGAQLAPIHIFLALGKYLFMFHRPLKTLIEWFQLTLLVLLCLLASVAAFCIFVII